MGDVAMRIDPFVIGWKTGNFPGITTKDGKIEKWPAAAPLPEPTAAEYQAWEQEYEAYTNSQIEDLSPRESALLDLIDDRLPANGKIRRQNFPAALRAAQKT